jgi:hypothetical protein
VRDLVTSGTIPYKLHVQSIDEEQIDLGRPLLTVVVSSGRSCEDDNWMEILQDKV